VTRGWLPQRAGLPGLNGGGAAAAVSPRVRGKQFCVIKYEAILYDVDENEDLTPSG